MKNLSQKYSSQQIMEKVKQIREEYFTSNGTNTAFQPFDLDSLKEFIKRLNGEVKIDNSLEYYGMIRKLDSDKPRFEILYKEAEFNNKRDLFTIAHELGHLFLHMRMPIKQDSNSESSRDWDNFSSDDYDEIIFARYGSNSVEYEANYFAAEFLMPEEEFKKEYKKLKSIKKTAEHFNVSPGAAGIRAKFLDIIPW